MWLVALIRVRHTPFPGQSECFVAVLLIRIVGASYLNGYCNLMFYACFFNVSFFIKVKNMSFMSFICKLMFLTSMVAHSDTHRL